MDKIKKLSDAGRLGATFREQCFGSLSIGGKTCFLGGALEAIGFTIPAIRLMTVAESSRLIVERFGVTHADVEEVMDRNDRCQQSREKIADWLASMGL